MRLTDKQKQTIKDKIWYGCTYASEMKSSTEVNLLAANVTKDIIQYLENSKEAQNDN